VLLSGVVVFMLFEKLEEARTEAQFPQIRLYVSLLSPTQPACASFLMRAMG